MVTGVVTGLVTETPDTDGRGRTPMDPKQPLTCDDTDSHGPVRHHLDTLSRSSNPATSTGSSRCLRSPESPAVAVLAAHSPEVGQLEICWRGVGWS